MKHYTIPVFIPELACPFRCVFCNQFKITGKEKVPGDEQIINTVEDYLSSFKSTDRRVELGFFGGSFTGLPLEQQEHYLTLVTPYILSGKISAIRLSTRPDYITEEVLDLLRKNNVGTIELGLQSLDEEVLKRSRRGHTVPQSWEAARRIREAGFDLGLQMMIGLPGDSLEKHAIRQKGSYRWALHKPGYIPPWSFVTQHYMTGSVKENMNR
ncbi:MAG: radical SAM protein [bacterium]